MVSIYYISLAYIILHIIVVHVPTKLLFGSKGLMEVLYMF